MSATVGTGSGVHDERVTSPQWSVVIRIITPTSWTRWDILGLTVESHNSVIGFTDRTSRDVFFDVRALDILHILRDGFGSGQPVRVIVSRSQVALFVHAAEHEWHGAELSHTRTSSSKILRVDEFVALGVKQGVAVP